VLVEPGVKLGLVSEDRRLLACPAAMHRQLRFSFPALNRSHRVPKVSGDLLPRNKQSIRTKLVPLALEFDMFFYAGPDHSTRPEAEAVRCQRDKRTFPGMSSFVAVKNSTAALESVSEKTCLANNKGVSRDRQPEETITMLKFVRVSFVVAATIALAALLVSPGPPVVSAKKKGGGNGPSRTIFSRATFGDPFAFPGVQTDGNGACGAEHGGPNTQYWQTIDPSDPKCGSSGNMQVTLTGPDGIWLQAHQGSTNLKNLPVPNPNRYFVLDFSKRKNDSSCPNLDMEIYDLPPGNFAEGYIPTPDGAACIDNVEAIFRVGTEVFDLPIGATFFEAKITIREPKHNAKGKKSAIEWPTAYTLTYVSPFVVTKSGIDGDIVTLTCDNECVVSLRQDGIELGTFDMPTQLTYQRLFCNDSDCISAP
jgi:hypothetical protein